MQQRASRNVSSPVADPPDRPGGRRLRHVPKGRVRPSAGARARAIAADAYTRAERRGFEPGHELEDWVAAERAYDTVHEGDHFAGE